MASKTQLAEAASKAGITTNPDGTRFIPASTRSDGSMRKEIKVKPGYRPPEDVEVYKNRTADAWKNRGKGGVPGAEGLGSSASKDKDNSASNKNAKRREARKRAAAEKPDAQVDVDELVTAEDYTPQTEVEEKVAPDSPALQEVEQYKEVKKLVKKLRQAKELKDKKDSGTALLPDQIGKVIRINELIRQLDSMGFDAHGEKKDEEDAV